MPRFRSFRETILTARDGEDVRRFVSNAMESMTAQEMAALPFECRQALADWKSDIHSTAVVLLRCDLKHRGEDGIGELLRQLSELFASASVRVSQIEHRYPA